MDVGRIISRAWEITWRWKVLWVLGFLAALGEATSGANSSWQFSSSEFQNGRVPSFNLPPMAGGLVAGLACLALLIALALWVISVIARGGLIAGAAQVETEGSTSLGRAWAEGRRRFWTLFGIGILTALPIILLVLAMLIGLFVVAGGAAALGAGGNQGMGIGGLEAGLLACLCPSICIVVIAGVVLSQIRLYAERAAVLENLGWTAAFGRGWRVLRDNLGITVMLWIVFLVLGLIVGAITLAIVASIFLPVVAVSGTSAANTTPNVALLGLVCGLGLIGVVVGAIAGSVINVFASATWTVAYREMTLPRTPLAPPGEPVIEG